MPPVALVDPATIDTSKVLIDLEGIRRGNPQRFEMEQLTAIVRLDPVENLIIGYKDVSPTPSSGSAATCPATRSCPA